MLDIGAGYCEFINNVRAAERVAIDRNPDVRRHAANGVRVHEVAAERLPEVLPVDHFDVAFASNFLEHCRSRDEMLAVLRAVRAVLKPAGRFMILGPNFRYCYRDYFDYFDHHLALTDRAVGEALEVAGFVVETNLPRTLPFSFNGKLPTAPWLVRLYLRSPWAWRVLGKQYFVVGKKTA